MSDLVVTVPKTFTWQGSPNRGLQAWIDEGDAAGTEWSGLLYAFCVWGRRPPIEPGERLYIVCEGRLRGYAPLVRLEFDDGPRPDKYGEWRLLRGGDAVAVTIPERITGFRGWRERWWSRTREIPFPDWATTDCQARRRAKVKIEEQRTLF